MSAEGGRLPVAISVLALVVAVVSAVAGSHDSSADFVVTSTSPGNQIVTLDPQGPATYSVPVSRPAGAVDLTWTASATESARPGLVTYSVHRSPAGAGTYTQLASGLTAYTYTDTPGADGSYDYKIRTDISSFSAESAVRAGLSDRTAPSIPVLTLKSGRLLGSPSVEAEWTESTDATSGLATWAYTIRWVQAAVCPAASTESYPNSARKAADQRSHDIPGSVLLTYCAYVIATDAAGNSALPSAVKGPTAAQ